MRFQAPRGTEDRLPDQTHLWRRLEHEFFELTSLYGYREIRTPMFEDTDLFVRSSGETSDIVSKQMYTFIDKGDRSITLKPEGTAPAIRAVIEHNLCPPGTVCRLSYATPFFRYERPQKGRLRQAHQFGLELLGSDSAAADAEIIEITIRFYERLGLKGLKVLLNSIGRSECRQRYRDALLHHAAGFLADTTEEQREKAYKNPLRLLDSKDPAAQAVMATAPSILDFLEPESAARLDELQRLLSDRRVPFEVAPGIVRGLDYYTETVFEVQSGDLGAQNALCGGGRYDNLVKELGGPPTPAVGVGIGIERVLIVLGEAGLLEPAPGPDVFVAYAGAEAQGEAFRLADQLREQRLSVAMDLDAKSLKSQLRQADKSGARFVAILGEDEIKEGKLTLRAMATSEQKTLGRAEGIKLLKEEARA
jgi:histidyl-tRNA synthetase